MGQGLTCFISVKIVNNILVYCELFVVILDVLPKVYFFMFSPRKFLLNAFYTVQDMI